MNSYSSLAPCSPCTYTPSDQNIYCEPNECFRSLWGTLVAAAASFAVFAAANWGMPPAMAERSLLKKVLYHIRFAFAAPFIPYLLCMYNAHTVNVVSMVVPKLRADHIIQLQQPQSAGTAERAAAPPAATGQHEVQGSPIIDFETEKSLRLLALCPIYLQIPQGSAELLGEKVGKYERLTEKRVRDLSPLRQLPPQCNYGSSNCIGVKVQNIIDKQGDQSIDIIAGDQSSSGTEDQWMFLKVPDTAVCRLHPAGAKAAERLERCALLASLASIPEYNDVRFLRSRSSFQSVLTAVQAIGYMVRVVERVTEGLLVSPIELCTLCLCFVILAQMTVEFYACTSYQRPLLLCLDSDELRRLCNAPRNRSLLISAHYNSSFKNIKVGNKICLTRLMGFLASNFTSVLMFHTVLVAVAMYKSYPGRDGHILFVLSLFLLGVAFLAAVLVLRASDYFSRSILYNTIVAPSLQIAVNALFVSGAVVVAIATILKWDELYKEPTHNNLWTRFFPYLSG